MSQKPACKSCGSDNIREYTTPGGRFMLICRECEKTRTARYRTSPKGKTVCKRITRRANLKRYYGLSEEDYNTMLAEQNGVCKICSKKPKNVLCVDHCHTSGKVRGLLCHSCNTHLGVIENQTKMELFRKYLLNSMS